PPAGRLGQERHRRLLRDGGDHRAFAPRRRHARRPGGRGARRRRHQRGHHRAPRDGPGRQGGGMTTDTARTPARAGLRIDFHVWGPVVALLALIALGAWLNPNFLSYGNVTNVLARSAFIGIIAVGMTFVITSGGL